ncbi:hypothetical protein GOP47_0019397 [Adiantum capillus-veneris]|uniref:Uncharacterized protein n=1 Tax=Adiantum capillus-veneris TaxID=13818 RepID=A0A9D4Z8K8_ADICA|nr:hypothetical protein GOP47_0019397 [Adiantum capillus-veneris]
MTTAISIFNKDVLLSWEPVKVLTAKKQLCQCNMSHVDDHIATLELSMADILYDYYNSVLLFYEMPPAVHEGTAASMEPARRLQQALEEMLAHYPCAAGLLVYNETADCLEPPLDLLYPSKPSHHLDDKGHPFPRFVMAFQVTTFECGGFTLGHTCSHAYADGYTGAAFLQNLCAIARGAGLANSLHMIPSRRAVISAREPPSPTMPHPYILARKPTEPGLGARHLHYGTATRFRFSMDSLEALRTSVSTPSQLKICSRNRALAALLCTAFARVSLNVHGLPGSQEFAFRIPVNMRTRGSLISMGYMGNGLCQLNVSATLQELCESPLAHVVEKIERTMESLDLDEKFQSMVDYVELQRREGLSPFIGRVSMPSLVGLPFYDTDCGWGAPKYVGRPSQQLSNRCIILDHPEARAWNVLVTFASSEEHACFRESIAKYIS